MSQAYHYSILLQWSDEDQTYVVILPDWEGRYLMPVASGKTYAEAFKRGVNALEHLIEVVAKYGESLPEPRTYSAAEEMPHA